MFQSDFQHIDAECFLLGMLQNGQLLKVPRLVCNEHVYIAGHTGSGKTVLGFIGLLEQVAREWKKARRDINDLLWRFAPDDDRIVWQDQPRPLVAVFDLKGDPVLFNTARILAKRNGYPFKYFSINSKRPGQIFDFFQSMQPCSPSSLAELLLVALGIEHGEGYGKSHYTRANLTRLSEVLIRKSNPFIRSWKHLLDLLRDRDNWNDMPSGADADELINAVHGMMVLDLSIDKLAANGRKPDNAGVIHMPTALRERQMLYFWLPSSSGSMSARYIGKLALYALANAAKELADDGKHIKSYIFIDEFHMLLGRNLEQILTQSRSSGVTLIMGNQYTGRLAEEDLNIRRMVLETVRIKQFFTVTDPLDIEEMARVSGQTTRMLKTVGRSESFKYDLLGQGLPDGYSIQESSHEILVPRFDIDICPEITEDPVGSLVWIQRGAGFAQFRGVPQYVQSFWPMKRYQHALRNGFHHMPWPTPDDDPPRKPQPPQKPGKQRGANPQDLDLFKKIQQDVDAILPATPPKTPKKKPNPPTPPEPKEPPSGP